MGDFIGPALPPHLQKVCVEADTDNDNAASAVIGPALPPHLSSGSGDSSERTETTDCGGASSSDDKNDANLDSEEGGADTYGPALPPGLVARSRSRVVGPTLPQDFRHDEGGGSSSSDEEVVGPLPPSQSPSSGSSRAHEALERRAQALKRKFIGEADNSEQDILKRETWMLELPPDHAKEFGLGPRQFRRRAIQDVGDRSVWTDTPQDKRNKKHSQNDESESEMQQIATRARDEEMEKLVKKHGKGREKEKSLLEKHQEELKKQKVEDEGKPKERRPFDRNIDLQANRFDEAQKRSIFKKAQLLNDRFSRGESKFL